MSGLEYLVDRLHDAIDDGDSRAAYFAAEELSSEARRAAGAVGTPVEQETK